MAAIFKAWILMCMLVSYGAALADAPARVGRIAHVQGEVDFRPAFGEPGTAALLNWPITTGNLVESGPHGHAEIRVGSTAIRIAPGSVVEIGQLDERRFLVYLTQGSVHLRVNPLSPEEFAVRTPTGRVRVPGDALLRIDIDRFDESSIVSVHQGAAILENGRDSLKIASGKKALMQRDDLHASAIAAADADAFDRWSDERDRSFRTANARHVSPEMTGYEELSRHGVWHQHIEFGTVWYPTVVGSDWAPYRHGHWAWIAPWGWTWIDKAPWAYAPTHYGRWAYIDQRWGWIPGAVTVRPVWAPALVGWIGGRNWSASLSFGGAPAVGWFPLGPNERYVPGYRVSDDHLHRLNPHHTLTVPPSVGISPHPSRRERHSAALGGDHRNRLAPNAVSILPQDQFSVPPGGTVQRIVPAASALVGQPSQLRSAPATVSPGPEFTTNSPPPTLSSPRFAGPSLQTAPSVPPSTARHGVIRDGSPALHGNPGATDKMPQFPAGAVIQHAPQIRHAPQTGPAPRIIDGPMAGQPAPGTGRFGTGVQSGSRAAMPQFSRPSGGLNGGQPGGLRSGR